MKTYKCKVRLAASPLDEVIKIGVTRPEIAVLKKIHGDDAVLDLAAVGEVTRTEAQERDRLEMIYPMKDVIAALGPAPVANLFVEEKEDPFKDEPEDIFA